MLASDDTTSSMNSSLFSRVSSFHAQLGLSLLQFLLLLGVLGVLLALLARYFGTL
jgi:hypothetical protein